MNKDGIMRIIQNEPILTRAIMAVITLLISFGLPISNDQVESVLEFTSIVILLVLVYSAREAVTPVAKAEAKIEEAYHADPSVDEKPTL